MKNFRKVLALVFAVLMCLGAFASCKTTPASSGSASTTDSKGNNTPQQSTTPLVVGYAEFNSKFSPFFAETAYDQDVYTLTSIGLLGNDRTGGMIYNGIQGETVAFNGKDYTYYGPADVKITQNDDGSVYYDFTLRTDIKFSDGVALTVDDVIFSMYVLCDPTYDGNSTLFAQPIKGMDAYRSGMTTKWQLIVADGKEASANGSADGYYTADEAKAFWEIFDKTALEYVQGIVDYCAAAAGTTDVAGAADAWGFDGLGVTTVEEFWNAILERHGYDMTKLDGEKADATLTSMISEQLSADLLKGVSTGESAANIAGIQKTGDNTFRVEMTEFDATAIYQLSLTIAPMHYYGETAKYNYDENKFGFDKGDLSHVRSVTAQPMGAGPYKFVKYDNGVVSFEANDSYYLGTPKIKYINFKAMQEKDKLNGIIAGTLDVTDPTFNKDAVAAIKKENSNGELNGDKVVVDTVDNLGYGYIGISAKAVNVGGVLDSKESKDLRKAFATVLSVYRDLAIDSYYGELASVINYPISNTSWAAPRPTDDGYKVAFSVDVNGNDIYTSDMTADQKYEAALKAALGYLEAAGYTVENGKVTAAPAGAKTEYEVQIPAGGEGDHPSFRVLSEASKALETIGIKLTVTDLSNSSALWTGIESDSVDMWCAAWGATIDPDMYQIYFSGNDTMSAGGSNYMYDIDDAELNDLILQARKSADQAYRKTMYKACLDIVVDWAVEIPVYQRQNAIVFRPSAVKMDTVTPDITTFYGWMSEVQNMEMAD